MQLRRRTGEAALGAAVPGSAAEPEAALGTAVVLAEAEPGRAALGTEVEVGHEVAAVSAE